MSHLNIAFDRYASLGTVMHYILVISLRFNYTTMDQMFQGSLWQKVELFCACTTHIYFVLTETNISFPPHQNKMKRWMDDKHCTVCKAYGWHLVYPKTTQLMVCLSKYHTVHFWKLRFLRRRLGTNSGRDFGLMSYWKPGQRNLTRWAAQLRVGM